MTTSFDPFREIDRILTAASRAQATAQSSLATGMDVYREGDRFVVAVDLPGVDPSTIDIDVDDRTLTLRAERRSAGSGEVQWLTRERPVGTYARQLTLGRGVATDRISADYVDGVLTLTIPVAEEAKPRKISVNRASGSIPGAVVSDTPAEQNSTDTEE